MAGSLQGKTIAILATDGFEQSELVNPKKALEEAGATTQVVSPKQGRIKGWDKQDWGEEVTVDISLESVDASEFDALLLPGGVMNPDKLRMDPRAVEFVNQFLQEEKPIAAICHGPWMLVETGAVEGRTITSWPSLKTDIENAGGAWVDREVVESDGIVTSRKPEDLRAFNRMMIDVFSRRTAEVGSRKVKAA